MAGATPEETLNTIQAAYNSFEEWKKLPAPRRGEYIRLIGEELRRFKEPLGKLVSLECGKVLSEGEGEVQEMIDIAEFAVGLSRTIGGATLPSERPDHGSGLRGRYETHQELQRFHGARVLRTHQPVRNSIET